MMGSTQTGAVLDATGGRSADQEWGKNIFDVIEGTTVSVVLKGRHLHVTLISPDTTTTLPFRLRMTQEGCGVEIDYESRVWDLAYDPRTLVHREGYPLRVPESFSRPDEVRHLFVYVLLITDVLLLRKHLGVPLRVRGGVVDSDPFIELVTLLTGSILLRVEDEG